MLLTGPFGVGKSTVAGLIAAGSNGAVLDPELLGADARAAYDAPDDDYQDLPLWRRAVLATAEEMCSEAWPGPVVIPMTLWRAAYYEELTQGLRRLGELTVVALAASKTTLLQRIEADQESGARPWRLAHMDVGLQALNTISSDAVLSTDHPRPDEVAEQILALVELGDG